MAYFVQLGPAGSAEAFFSDAFNVIPSGAIALTDAQYAQWSASPQSWSWQEGNLAPVVPVVPAPTAASVSENIYLTLSVKSALGVYYQPASATAPVLFWTDPGSIVKLSAAMQLVALNLVPAGGTPFLACTPAPVMMLASDIAALGPKASAYVLACDANAATLLGEVNAGNLAVDLTAGWPSNA